MIIFGVGGFAEVIARYIGLGNVDAFTVDADYIQTLEFLGKKVIPFEEIQEHRSPLHHEMLIVVTQQNRHRGLLRARIIAASKKGYSLAKYIHPTAIVLDGVYVADNCIIGPGAIIEVGTMINSGAIVRSGAYIGHHCQLFSDTYIAPRASMSGYVKVGTGAFIGNNATIRDRITIGKDAVIGAGAVVLRDVAPGEVYQGYPARLLSIEGKDVKI